MDSDRDTIVAPATASGGALVVIRLAGPEAVAIADCLYCGSAPLAELAGGRCRFGTIRDGERTVDEVVATLFRAPHSYTGEDAVEFSCHGSPYIVGEVLRLALAAGARMAEPGEFTRRAYLNGKMDLSQAEAVADLIAASSRTAHALATEQLRGGYSSALDELREQLVHLAALLELELDFGEEEVAFADRHELAELLERIGAETERLRASFALGNALKEGVAVAIVGAPNVGKSTLLNRLLREERAMVSEIAGTTRDVIEERLTIDGVTFRLLDTAGIRHTEDRLERMGIERTMRSIERARIVVRMVDATTLRDGGIPPFEVALRPGQQLLTVLNKIDALAAAEGRPKAAAGAAMGALKGAAVRSAAEPAASVGSAGPAEQEEPTELELAGPTGQARQTRQVGSAGPAGPVICEAPIPISARSGEGIEALRQALRQAVPTTALDEGTAVVSSARHYDALTRAGEALDRARRELAAGVSTDLLSEEIRAVSTALASITGRGAILPDELLQHIFSTFCIGK